MGTGLSRTKAPPGGRERACRLRAEGHGQVPGCRIPTPTATESLRHPRVTPGTRAQLSVIPNPAGQKGCAWQTRAAGRLEAWFATRGPAPRTSVLRGTAASRPHSVPCRQVHSAARAPPRCPQGHRHSRENEKTENLDTVVTSLKNKTINPLYFNKHFYEKCFSKR